jgi:hypothetical protein
MLLYKLHLSANIFGSGLNWMKDHQAAFAACKHKITVFIYSPDVTCNFLPFFNLKVLKEGIGGWHFRMW